MKILVLCGGLSPERAVSLTSGSLIADALARRGHEVAAIDLYTGKDLMGNAPVFSAESIEPFAVDRGVPDLEALKAQTGRGDCRIGEGVMALCHEADVVFIALHGDVGENGQLQAALDMEGICYTGSGYIGSLLAMDKDLSKQILSRAGIATPPWVFCRLSAKDDLEAIADHMMAAVGLPAVIKPCACGSSVGVSMADTREEFISAVRAAAAYEQTLLAERRIAGRELTVGILGNRVLPAVEIIPTEGFYDYENKYQVGRTVELCPAPLTGGETEMLADTTRRGFEALRLHGYARFDYILDADGVAWCLEANTLPGMTPTSLLPQAAAAIGIEYGELCEMMARMALEEIS